MEEHNKTNERKHLKMATFFAVAKMKQLDETNNKLSKEVNRVTAKIEQSEETNTKLSKEVNRLTEANTKLSKEVNRVTAKTEQSEKRNTKLSKEVNRLTDKIEQSEETNKLQFSKMKRTIEEQSTIIESITYPLELRDRIKESDMRTHRFLPIDRFETSWRFINLILTFSCSSRDSIPVSITMEFNKVMSPLAKWPFEGRFRLTIIDRVNTNNSPVYESPVVKLQPKPEPEQGFNLKEQHPNQFDLATKPKNIIFAQIFRTENNTQPTPEQGFKLIEQHPNQFEIATISKHLLQERFNTGKGNIEFTLQIQEAEHVRL